MKKVMFMRGCALVACLACGIGVANAESDNWNLIGAPVSLSAELKASGNVEAVVKTTGKEHNSEFASGEETVGFAIRNTGDTSLLGYNAGLQVMPDNLSSEGVAMLTGDNGHLLVDADVSSGWQRDDGAKGVYVYGVSLKPQEESGELKFKVRKKSILLSGEYSMSVIGVVYHP
ncbi:hypothetical protein [Escherichia coli]|uniref:hypothetical protein n=1 Tax=Escherichia coli TaxID=562 RepID=UPI00287AC41C|nr:hypothetical protein [Escherichia coli]MDS1619814.1 hypothetical protein [Escherichia coli]